MRPFEYERTDDAVDAVARVLAHVASDRSGAAAQYLAGGTNVLDLMKIGVVSPRALVDINDLGAEFGDVVADDAGLHLGALARMSAAAEHGAVREDWPAIGDALRLAASAQLRNMASLAGNVLQRTRCNYFRDVSWPCNKRKPGSGCAAMEGVNRRLAVLGVSDHCIANYPGDFANVLAAFEATVDIADAEGRLRTIAFETLHRLPDDTPHHETSLVPGELITTFHVPRARWTRRSVYVKVRDRSSYDFALTSAVVGLDVDDGLVRDARIGLGGLVAKPWRSREAEDALRGHPPDEARAMRAAEAAFAHAVTHGDNDFKPDLGRRTLVRAILEAAALPESLA